VSYSWRSTFIISAKNVLHVDRDADVSMRQVDEESNVSYMTICRVLNKQLLLTSPFRTAWSHAWWLSSATEHLSLFCLTKYRAFLCFISALSSWGTFLYRLHYQYSQPAPVGSENPHGVIPSKHQQQFSINVSAGIVGHCLVGPHVLPLQAYRQTTTEIYSYIIYQSYWRVWHLPAVMFPEDGPHPTWYLRRK
jgi:hypothetical protein